MPDRATRLRQMRHGGAEPMEPRDFREARDALGLTQEQFAQVLGYGSKSRIAELEAGTRSPGGAVLRLIRAYLSGYRPSDWPRTGKPEQGARRLAVHVVSEHAIARMPVEPETLEAVRSAMRTGLRRPGEIARHCRLGLLTVQEAIEALEARKIGR